MLSDIWVNILSDFLFLFLAIVLAWIYYRFTDRKKLLKFFSIEKTKRITIYLSNLRVTQGGAIGVDGKHRAYNGSAVAFGEVVGARKLEDLFRYFIPSITDLPGILGKLLIADIKTQTEISPLQEGGLDQTSTFIALGSPAYNVSSGFIEQKGHSQVQFRLGNVNRPIGTGKPAIPDQPYTSASGTAYTAPSFLIEQPIEIPPGVAITSGSLPSVSNNPRDSGDKDIPSAMIMQGIPEITETDRGFVERVLEQGKNRNLFYVAGLSELGTMGAAYYLANEWKALYEKFGGDQPFVVMLKIEPTDYKKSTLLFER